MKWLAIILVVISCFLVAPVGVSGQNGPSMRSKAQGFTYVPGELLVKYKPSVRAAATEYFRSRMGVSTIEHFNKDRRPAREASQGMSVEEALEIYRSDPDVDYVEPNSLRYATATTPVDPFFTRLWGLNNTGQNVNGTTGTVEADIDATEAWDTTTGSNNVVVAVIDSGVDYNQPDLAANIGLDTSTTYYYRVRSYNGSNNSDFSPEASATTTSSDGGGGGGGGPCFIATAALAHL